MKEKIFRDPVHGYIRIDEDIVNEIIDSPIFQRLRRIEQTSMRCVYPSARHDRFSHSLGVYCLAKKVSSSVIRQANESALSGLTFNFELAALLHDVGHSPMSHTLEGFFGSDNGNGDLYRRLDKKFCSEVFYSDCSMAKPAVHEIISAIITVEQFCDAIARLCVKREAAPDIEFIARCIVGATYSGEDINKRDFKNALIRMLNSNAIDVDKLDYIKRDSVISGYDNVSVDIDRLLSSLKIQTAETAVGVEGETFVYGKSALSVIQNVVDCRNMLYTWIYSHHKVVYETYLIKHAVQKAIEAEAEKADKSYEELLADTFSISRIVDDLFCDDDIWTLLKKHREIDEVRQLLDRRLHFTSLWKTRVEFDIQFPNINNVPVGQFKKIKMRQFIAQKGADFDAWVLRLCAEYGEDAIIIENTKVRTSIIRADDIYVDVNGKCFSFWGLNAGENDYAPEPANAVEYFYVYVCGAKLKQDKKALFDNDRVRFTEALVSYIKSEKQFLASLHGTDSLA
jgi:HD superfamily phosphohydrolase